MLLSMNGIRVAPLHVFSFLSEHERELEPCWPNVDVCAKYATVEAIEHGTDSLMHLEHEKVLPEVNEIEGGVLKKHSSWTGSNHARIERSKVGGPTVSWKPDGVVREFAW